MIHINIQDVKWAKMDTYEGLVCLLAFVQLHGLLQLRLGCLGSSEPISTPIRFRQSVFFLSFLLVLLLVIRIPLFSEAKLLAPSQRKP